MRKDAGNWSLLGIVVALAIVCVLAATYFMKPGGSSRPDGKGTTTVGAALYSAKDTQCKNHLDQIRQIISIEVETSGDTEPTYPASINDVRGIGSSMKQCPIGKEPYAYDPATGKVSCPHPGHEKY